jgi:hypothetical protein
MPKGGHWDENTEYRERRPWPAGVRFTDAKTEKVIDQRRPPRPLAQSFGTASGACAESIFAEGAVGAGDYLAGGRPRFR